MRRSVKPERRDMLRLIKGKPSSLIYWSRAGLAVIVAYLCMLLGFTDFKGLTFSTFIYVSTYYLFRYGLDIKPERVGGESQLISIGLGSYFLIWLTVWSLLYTLSY